MVPDDQPGAPGSRSRTGELTEPSAASSAWTICAVIQLALPSLIAGKPKTEAGVPGVGEGAALSAVGEDTLCICLEVSAANQLVRRQRKRDPTNDNPVAKSNAVAGSGTGA